MADEPLEAVRKGLEHVAMADFEESAKKLLEDNGLFHNEYERAYKFIVKSDPPEDAEYWNSLTSDVFFLIVALVSMAERELDQYDEYTQFIVDAVEIVGNGAR